MPTPKPREGETPTHPQYGPWDIYEGVPPATFVIVPKDTEHPIPGVPAGAEPVQPPTPGDIPIPPPEGAHPAHPVYLPPGIWPSPGHPAHPIAPGGPPPYPSHPIYWPPVIWPGPGYPAHPIAPGGPPPGIWPSPGHPAHPIAPGGPPPHPEHPWIPPGSVVIPPPSPGVPTHPIVIPPPVDTRPVYLVYVVNLPPSVSLPGTPTVPGGTPASPTP